jgi:Flp pilus assembly CpaF family ATPase
MQAIMGISPNICVAIRRHGTKEMRLPDLYKSGMFSETMLRFLKSLIAAGVNVIIAGIQGAGKTTLLRAMGLEIPESEHIATLETDYELYLHHFHNQVIALTEQRSSTANTIKLKDLIPIVLRMNVIRLIVGEVRSQEIIPMIEAMTAGASGSMCTIHAMNPDAVLGRLIELIQTSVASATIESAKRRISNAINFTIYVNYEDYTHIGGSKKRFISNIVEYVPSGTDITTANIFEDGEFKTRPSKYVLERLLRIDKDIMEIFGKYH